MRSHTGTHDQSCAYKAGGLLCFQEKKDQNQKTGLGRRKGGAEETWTPCPTLTKTRRTLSWGEGAEAGVIYFSIDLLSLVVSLGVKCVFRNSFAESECPLPFTNA